jgi:hypothetical protein
MGVALDDLLDAAVERGERIDEGRSVRRERRPIPFFKTRITLNAIPPAKRAASAPCWAARIFTAKAPACVNMASVDEERSRQTTSEGGERESEASAVAVQPARSFPFEHVTIATPEANSRIARRKFALLASGYAALIASASLKVIVNWREHQNDRSVAHLYWSAHASANKRAVAVGSVSQPMKGELLLDPQKKGFRLADGHGVGQYFV